ncbi:MAG: hypothetical protein NTY95_18285 [Bacteroidia bacterium]|nr:hypothetical protein [Bacteroidia bacterium]
MEAIGDIVDSVMVGDDLAGQEGSLFSPDYYRSVVKPRHKKLVQHMRSLTKAKIWYHTCGSYMEYIPDLIDIGVDIINPVQTSARNMDPVQLKKHFGKIINSAEKGIIFECLLSFYPASCPKTRTPQSDHCHSVITFLSGSMILAHLCCFTINS